MTDSRKFGIELEVADGAATVLDELGLNDGLHSYHCGCSRCDHGRDFPDWTAQQDCTADGEFISRVLRWGSEEAENAIDTLGAALTAARPSVQQNVGQHVHVSLEDLTTEQKAKVYKLVVKFQPELEVLAQAQRGNVRGYNDPMQAGESFWTTADPYCSGSWLRTCRRTFEFRLWNSTRSAWRLRLHAAISVAIVEHAADVTAKTVTEHDGRTLIEVLSPYMDVRTLADYVKQLTVANAHGSDSSIIN